MAARMTEWLPLLLSDMDLNSLASIGKTAEYLSV